MPLPPPWMPAPLHLASSDDMRSPDALRQTLAQFDLTDPRYLPGTFGCPGTRCNVALWDYSRAMSASIPHWIDTCGREMPPDVHKYRELSAAGQIGWLRVFGEEEGWFPCSPKQARVMANMGRPVVAGWVNPLEGKPSHVAMLLPTPDDESEPRIAQAGAANLFDVPLPRGFGPFKPEFWAHS
jgi:hypothetical protein